MTSSRRIRDGALVEITSHEPMGFVTDCKADPDHPGELLYLVRSWRTASELRVVSA